MEIPCALSPRNCGQSANAAQEIKKLAESVRQAVFIIHFFNLTKGDEP